MPDDGAIAAELPPDDAGAGFTLADAPADPKRPLHRPLAPAAEFPIHALGELRLAAEAIAELVQAPPAICAQAVLAAATLAIQAHRDVELPGAGRRPLTGLFVSVAESGDRKSSVDRLALARSTHRKRSGGPRIVVHVLPTRTPSRLGKLPARKRRRVPRNSVRRPCAMRSTAADRSRRRPRTRCCWSQTRRPKPW